MSDVNPSLQPTPIAAPRSYAARSMQAEQVARPAFTLTPMTRTRTEMRAKKDENGFVTYPVEVTDEGFMVKTRRGDEVFLTSYAEVQRLGLDKLVPLIADNAPDDPVGYVEPNLGQPTYTKVQVEELVQQAVAQAMAVYKAQMEGDKE